jgi:hypothetical protein
MTGIDLIVTHTGATDQQLHLTDIGVQFGKRPGPTYINPGDVVAIAYTSPVSISFHQGSIRGYINLGYITVDFALSSEVLEATGFQAQIDALDVRVTALEGGGGGGAIELLQGGVTVMASASELNFASGATVVDGGGGQGNVTITGGGASSEDFAATCPVTVAVNDAVYLTGSLAVDRALGTFASGAYEVIGFVSLKGSPTACTVQTDGNLAGFVGLTPGATYYLSASVLGGITATPPSTPGEMFKKVGTATGTTTLAINLDEDQVLL